METSKSTPHCSLIAYLNKDALLVPSFLQDVRTFFKKFPLHYEAVFVIEKGAKDVLEPLKKALQESREKESFQLVRNTKFLNRSESLRQGIRHAQGAFIIVADPAMATPLGDLFKLLQNLMAEDSLDLVFGERSSKKHSPLNSPTTARHKLENLFNKILLEKHPAMGADSLCEITAIRKTVWAKIEAQLPAQRGWYLSPDLRQTAHLLGLRFSEIYINDSGMSPHSFSGWRERWTLLRKSIF